MLYLREAKVTYTRHRVKDDVLEKYVNNAEDVYQLFKDMQDETKEKVISLHLNPQLEILSYEVVAMGSPGSVLIDPIALYKGAMLASAHSIIVVCNTGIESSKPSSIHQDIAKNLYDLGSIHRIALQDFVVIGYKDFYSFNEQGHFSELTEYNKHSPR